MRPDRYHPRRRLHRAFLQWLRYHPEIADMLLLTCRSDTCMTMRVRGFNPALEIILTAHELDVVVQHENICWDYLRCFDDVPEKTPDGYTVFDAAPEYASKRYSSREELWEEMLFEQLRVWLVDVLPRVGAIYLYGSPSYATWATLCENFPKSNENDGRRKQNSKKILTRLVRRDLLS